MLVCGALGGILITLLKWSEYRFVVIEHSIEIYSGLTAAIFAGLGIWLGIKLTAKPRRTKEVQLAAGAPLVVNQRRRDDLGITPRELEILEPFPVGAAIRISLISAAVSRKKGPAPVTHSPAPAEN